MWGKHFESTYTGSMVGAGADIFAIWGYVIANARDGLIELNPKLIAFLIGMEIERVEAALLYLTSPDPSSRSQDEEGRRLVKTEQFMCRMVNWDKYHDMRQAEERREYMRNLMRKRRGVSKSLAVSKMLAHSESDTESDTDPDTDKDKDKDTTGGSKHPDPASLPNILRVVEEWNRTAERCGLPKVVRVTSPRRRAVGARIKEVGLDAVLVAMARVGNSAFLCGEVEGRDGREPFRASFDFVIAPSHFTRLIEGVYDRGIRRRAGQDRCTRCGKGPRHQDSDLCEKCFPEIYGTEAERAAEVLRGKGEET